jgi:hypothetical protein
VEYHKPPGNGRRGRRGKARPALGNCTVRRGGCKGLCWERRGTLPIGGGGSGTGEDGMVRGRRRAAAAGRLRRRTARRRAAAAAPIFWRKLVNGEVLSWAGPGMDVPVLFLQDHETPLALSGTDTGMQLWNWNMESILSHTSRAFYEGAYVEFYQIWTL